MKITKKLFAVIMSAVMIITMFAGVTASAYSINPYPVIFVNGLATSDLINTETGERVFPFPQEKMTQAVKDIIGPAVGALALGRYKQFGDPLIELAETLFGDLECDENGVPVLPTTYNPKDAVDLEQDFTQYYVPGVGYTTDREITMTYDWRLSPVIIADDLNDLIEAVCESTGADKVKLTGFSMGSSVVNSYIARYGYDRIDSVMFLAGAYNGLNSAGEPFAGRVSSSGKAIVNFLPVYIDDAITGQLITALVDTLYDFGIVDNVVDKVLKIVEVNKDYVYENTLSALFGRWASLWAFVPYDQYDDAKAVVGANAGLSDEFIELIDYYHYEVQGKTEERINYFLDNGINFGIITKYGYTTTPVQEDLDLNGDGIIEAKYESFGGTLANAGETLGGDYVQAVQDGHDHVSPDNKVDASTCKFPEYTWFVKNCPHASNSGLSDLRRYIMLSDEQVSVWDNEDFPQFMIKTADGDVVPLTEENDFNAHTAKDKNLFEKIRSLFDLIKIFFKWVNNAIAGIFSVNGEGC